MYVFTPFSLEVMQHIVFTPVNIYLFKVNNRSPRKRCDICPMLKIKTPERCY